MPDTEDPELATLFVQALNEATQRAITAGYPVVLVEDGNLVRREGEQVTVLRPIRHRVKVKH